MTSEPVLTGEHFINGDEACAEGALAAGCRFFGGYPITPATEVAERMARRLPSVGGIYIQMEDEIASIAAVLGAAWGGAKAMTSTSGPGFSLMMGTSMATPHMAGLIALWQDYARKHGVNLDYTDIHNILRENGHDRNTKTGWGVPRWDWVKEYVK